MNRKGFTLIELLAVIVILSTISLVAVSSLTKSLNDRDIKECKEQISLAKNAAKIYFSLNEDAEFVCVQTLINDGYFSGDKKTDRLNKSGTDAACNGKIELEEGESPDSTPHYVYVLYDDSESMKKSEEERLKVCN